MGPMTQADIDKWFAENGGELQREGPDANGVTTYRARNGQYINIDASGLPRMRGYSPPEGGSPEAPAAAAAQPAAPAVRPGGGMDQAALDAKLAQLQQQYPGLTFMGQSMKDKTVRRTNAFGDEVTETVRTPVVEWVDPKTGYTLTAEVEPGGGSYTITNDRLIRENIGKPGDAGDAAPPGGKPYIDEDGPNGRRLGWNPATKQYDRDLGSSPSAQAAAATPPKEEVNPSDPTRLRKPDGRGGWVDAGPNAAVVQANQQRDDTTVVSTDYTGVGQGRKKVTTYKSGRTTTEAAPTNAAVKAIRYETRNGRQVKVSVLDDGTETTEEDKPNPAAAPLPSGVRPFVPDPSDPNGDYGVSTYNAYLQGLRRQGIINYDQGRELLMQAGQVVQTADTRNSRLDQQAQTARGQDITQRGQDIGEVASRRSAAGNAYQQADSQWLAMLKGMSGSDAGGLAAEAFLSALNLQQQNATDWGGMQDVPQVDPAVMQAARGATQITAHPDGRIEVSPPGAPPAAATNAAPAAAPVPAAQNAGAGTGEPPARGALPQPGGVNPPAGQPGNDPTKPVGILPPNDPYMAALRPQAPAPPATFQPDVAALKAQFPGITDEELQQAISEHQQEMAQVA